MGLNWLVIENEGMFECLNWLVRYWREIWVDWFDIEGCMVFDWLILCLIGVIYLVSFCLDRWL